jgi:hypothetical protein
MTRTEHLEAAASASDADRMLICSAHHLFLLFLFMSL